MNAVIEKISAVGIVPVIKIDDVEKAVPLAKALIAGGIPCAEVTFRTAQGEEAIRRIHDAGLDLVLGAGTVLTTDQVDRAIAAGAQFIVSPGLNPKVVAYCIEKGVAITPGCSSPTDIEQAMEFGIDVIKFFPAEQSGGLDYIKAVSAPYPNLRFMPTGGVNADNIAKYLAFDRVVACGGSWMVKGDLIEAGDFAAITALCRKAVLSMLGFEVAHVGINAANQNEATKAAMTFEALFGFAAREGNSSIFAGQGIEVMKAPYLGKQGHIAVAVNSVFRAKAFLERQGVVFNEESAKRDGKGKLMAIYLQEEIAGFAIHLVQRN